MSCTTSTTPVACTLSSERFNDRLARIALTATQHLLAQHQDGPTLRLRYSRQVQPVLRSLVELERDCCAFLAFDPNEQNGAAELAFTAPSGTEAAAAVFFE